MKELKFVKKVYKTFDKKTTSPLEDEADGLPIVSFFS